MGETADQLRAVLAAHASPALRATIEPLIQPAIAIEPTALADDLDAAMDSLALGASRFGGIPDLPPGAAWPARDDVPMEFVAQVRLADVAPLDARWPARGSLLFFYNSQHHVTDQGVAHCCAVLYHAGPDAELVRTPPPFIDFRGEYEDGPRRAPWIHGIASLAFTATDSAPSGPSPWLEGELLGEWQDFLYEHGDAWLPRVDHRLLGYANAGDWVDAHANGTADQLLFQVQGDEHCFTWGDVYDRLYFFITAAELAARDFSHARLHSRMG
ncbi:MAG TPA: YwqG family protein [Kofleriaceae bacterium]|jgi:hypothetical protein